MLGAESNESAPPALNHGISLLGDRSELLCVWYLGVAIPYPWGTTGLGTPPSSTRVPELVQSSTLGAEGPKQPSPKTLCKQWECVASGHTGSGSSTPQAPLSKLWQHNPKTYTPAYGIQSSSKCQSLPPRPTFCSSESLNVVVSSARRRMAPIFQHFCLKLVGFSPV